FDDAIAIVSDRARRPDLVVVAIAGDDLRRLHQLACIDRGLPIVVLCDAQYIDAVHLAGAAESVTMPARPRELVGRIRCALRDRNDSRQRFTVERKKSDKIIALRREMEDLER